MNTRNTVPSWSVPLVSTLVPVSVFILYFVVMRPSRLELHNTILACWNAVIVTAVITNLVKLGVRISCHTPIVHTVEDMAWL